MAYEWRSGFIFFLKFVFVAVTEYVIVSENKKTEQEKEEY
jgi:hypothetical protein